MTAMQESVVEVDRPIDEVAAWWNDFAFNLPRLRGSTLAARKTTPGPLGLGSRIETRVQVLGFETRFTGVVTRFDPQLGGTLTLEEDGIFRSGTIEVAFEPTATGTKITRRATLEPRGIARLLWPIVWPALARRSEVASRNLKRVIESRDR